MRVDEAIALLNERLNLDLRRTVRGDELKGAFPDAETGRTDKGFLGADDCDVCARAFAVVAAALASGAATNGGGS